MKKLIRYSKLLQVMVVVFLITCMVLPVGIAYAETPVSVSVVAADVAAQGLGSPFQHHSFIDDGTNWVLYYANETDSIVASYSDDGTTWVAHPAIAYYNTTVTPTPDTPGGQFDTWWDAGDSTLHVIVVNSSANESDIMYAAFDVDSVAHTLTIDGLWVVAVDGIANVSYRNPTICITNNESPFITYGYVNNSVSDVYVVTTNNSAGDPWLPEVNFPMYNLSANASRPSMYGSVIPLYTSNDNVSVQCASYNGSRYKLIQSNITWNGTAWLRVAATQIDSSSWYLPQYFEWNYNAVSVDTVINNDDVVIQCGQTNGPAYRTFVNRRGNESNIWAATYAQNFGQGGYSWQFIGAMGIRNNTYGIVYSAWDMAGSSTDIWSNDYTPDPGNGTWSGIANVYDDIDIPLVNTMSDYTYDIAGEYGMGFIYGTTTNDRIMYGLYSPAVPTPVGDAGTTILQLILPLLIAVLVLILILKAMPEAGVRGVIMAIALAAIVGAIAFQIVKAVVDML